MIGGVLVDTGGLVNVVADKGLLLADAWKQPVPGYDQDWRVALSWKVSIRP